MNMKFRKYYRPDGSFIWQQVPEISDAAVWGMLAFIAVVIAEITVVLCIVL